MCEEILRLYSFVDTEWLIFDFNLFSIVISIDRYPLLLSEAW
jgi:hypothetical protein